MRLTLVCDPFLIVYCLHRPTESSKMHTQVSCFIPWGRCFVVVVFFLGLLNDHFFSQLLHNFSGDFSWIISVVILPLLLIQEGLGSCQPQVKICEQSTGLQLRGLSLPKKSVSRSADWLKVIWLTQYDLNSIIKLQAIDSDFLKND